MPKTRQLRLTHERLREVVHYDPRTGSMVWRRTTRAKIKAGAPVGAVDGQGYLRVVIDGEILPGQRLAWFYVHGEWPTGLIRFANKNKTDLRIANLFMGKKPAPKVLTQARLLEALHYDADSGIFTWKVSSPRAKAGSEAGVLLKIGYRAITVDGQRHLAHRLAWFYVHGTWPTHMIDHINGNRADNRISNLRSATARQNTLNGPLRSTNTSGFKGVSWASRRKKWTARITSDYRVYILGYFDTKEEAHAAYSEAAKDLHGEFARR